MFRAFSRPPSGAQWLQWQPLVLPSYCGDSRAVFVVGPATPTTNTARLSPRYEGKTETATAVIELLMMGGKTPETYWTVNKRQDNKLKNCCIRLVIYLNCTTMHGLTNLKFYIEILARPVCKMWIKKKKKKVPLWNKRHFEEKNRECAACLKCSVLTVLEKNI
jgi:hypothetical protein